MVHTHTVMIEQVGVAVTFYTPILEISSAILGLITCCSGRHFRDYPQSLQVGAVVVL
jgi:ABC-type polysaccharide/polyol phosphate export permease